MSERFQDQIVSWLRTHPDPALRPRRLARALDVAEDQYHAFRGALRELMDEGRLVFGARGAIVLPTATHARDQIVGTYRHNRRGFGFVVPTDPGSHEDLYIPEGHNAGAITGDVVRATITSRGQRAGKAMCNGKVTDILQRTHKRFVGAVAKLAGKWVVLPDGNVLSAPILTPDAASRHVKPGTKVVVELTEYPEGGQWAQGVITEILGRPGDKDVDLRGIIIQYNLPGDFPDPVQDQARHAIDSFNVRQEQAVRMDLSDRTICTIDPDDAKDYDDAISLRQLDSGLWELGVHIADVSHFVPAGSPMDEEAFARGNSCYFPGFVIPMLPEVLSNGICSLQEAVPRLCKSAFIVLDDDARPVSTSFANTIIRSAKRLNYREAQAIIDGAREIPHPDGPRRIEQYPANVVKLLADMNKLAKRIQKRRLAAGQIVLELPEVELVLDEEGKVVGTKQEDQSFTHTLIEMFMVEANEAVARLLDSLEVPFIRRIHPEPEPAAAERLRHFIQVAGYKIPKDLDRFEIQRLLAAARGRPESYTINLAILKSLSRAEYSPQPVGHYALASQQYCHFTSPIRRYADLTVHRLLDEYFAASGDAERARGRKRKLEMQNVIGHDRLVEIGRHLSFTERRADDAERELRQVKILELLKDKVGAEFVGVITGITSFGIFVQLGEYLIDGLIRYEELMDDWWDVDERSGTVRGQRTGKRIGIGDVATVVIVNVDVARRELNLAVRLLHGKAGQPKREAAAPVPARPSKKKKQEQRHGRQQQRRGRR